MKNLVLTRGFNIILMVIILPCIYFENSLALSKPSRTSKPTNISIKNLVFDKYQLARIDDDMPVLSAQFYKNHSVVFSGRKYLWLYNMKNRALKRIKLSEDPATFVKILKPFDDSIKLIRNNELYTVRPLPFLKVYKHSLNKLSETILDIGVFNLIPTIVTSSGVYQISGSANIEKISNYLDLPKNGVSLKIGSAYIWLFSESELWRWDIKTKNIKKIAKDIRGIKDVKVIAKKVILQTKYSLIILDKDGRIDQTIPVSSSRQLVKFVVSDHHHMFLFDDKQVEIYSVDDRQIKYTSLPVGLIKKVSTIDFKRGKILSLLDGEVKIFQLEGNWK